MSTSKTLKLRCYFCGGKLRSDNAWVEIHDQELPPFRFEGIVRFNEHGGQELRGALTYPGSGRDLVLREKWSDYTRTVIFAHTECGPDIGYNFSFDRLDENWDQHLQGKCWWFMGIPEALEIARAAMNIKAPEFDPKFL